MAEGTPRSSEEKEMLQVPKLWPMEEPMPEQRKSMKREKRERVTTEY